jgi:LPS sulfotransferase NodH
MTAGGRPILLTGIPRSGTTWVARILTASGEVGHINEPFNLAVSPGTLRVPADHWYAYVTAETEDRYLPALTSVLEFEYPLVRELRRCRSRTDVLHTLKWWRDFMRSRGLRPLVKEPHAVFSAGWFAERLGSDVVVMVREPLAVVSSWKRLEWSFDFTNLLEQPALMRDWLGPYEAEMTAALSPARDLVDRVALLWRVIYSVVADERFPAVQLVRHEDLSRDPVHGYARLYEALGLTFRDTVATAVEASSSSENPAETSVERPHETQIDSRANLQNWRHRLSEEEIARIRTITEETASLYYRELVWA